VEEAAVRAEAARVEQKSLSFYHAAERVIKVYEEEMP
jgi:hypothetical protein